MGFQESFNNDSSNNVNLASNKKVILWLILFFPYGLYLMWKKTDWNKNVKIGISALFAVLCIIILATNISDSETVKSNTGITNLNIEYNQDINLNLSTKSSSSKKISVRVETDNKTFSKDDLEFVCSNPQIVNIEPNGEAKRDNTLYFYINGLAAGETTIYLQTIDGIVKSNEIKVICSGEIPTTTEPTTKEITTEETTIEQEAENKSNSEKSGNKNSSAKSNGNKGNSSNSSKSSQNATYILNTNTKVYHKPGCRHIKQMNESNKEVVNNCSAEEIENKGYKPCGTCMK